MSEVSELNDFYKRAMDLAHEWGMDPFPCDFHIVPAHRVYEIASYGVPGHFGHWTYGRDYWKQKTAYDKGQGRIYELVINSDPSQAFLLDTNSKLDNLFVIAHVLGHCYLPGTPISTLTRGIINIENVNDSDLVTNLNGGISPVKPTVHEYDDDVVELSVGGQKFSQTKDHRLMTLPVRPDLRNHNGWKSVIESLAGQELWLEAQYVQEGDWLVANITEPSEQIESIHIPHLPYIGKQASRARDGFNIPLSENFGELIGFYLAEGYSSDEGQCGICFNSNEIDYHKRVHYLIQSIFGLKTYDSISVETHSHTIQFNNKQISKWLGETFGRGSQNKHLGYDLLRNSNKDFLRGVLRGYLQGDGHFGERDISFSTTSNQLASEIMEIAMIFGGYFSYNERNRSGRLRVWEPYMSGPNSRQLRQELGVESEALDINREFSNAYKVGSRFYIKVISKKINHYKGPVHCVQAQNGRSFTLANKIITHNTDFFKRNAYFAETNRHIEVTTAAAASRIREYELEFGRSVVEDFIDDVFAIKEHIDTTPRLSKKDKKYEIATPYDPYEDLYPEETRVIEAIREDMQYDLRENFPSEPEKDVLGFIMVNGKLKDWQRDVISIIRDEMQYFLPQMQTKIMNEGWASMAHHEMMHYLDVDCDPAGIDFADVHSGVLSARPGALNPYLLGYNIYRDICMSIDETDRIVPNSDGWKKALEVVSEDRDETFIRTYLSEKVCEQLDLYSFSYDGDEYGEWTIKKKDWELVRDSLASSKGNMGMPYIQVVNGDGDGAGVLIIEHVYDGRPLDSKWAAKTMVIIARLWGRPVVLTSKDDGGEVLVTARHDEDTARVSTSEITERI